MSDEERATFSLRAMVAAMARISWEIPHARERAIKRDIPLFEAERIVRLGSVTKVVLGIDGIQRWRVSGWDCDSRPIDVVVKPIGDTVLRVVTVIRTDE